MTGKKPFRPAALAVLALAFAGFFSLGVWQLGRLAWKLDLIARVDARVHAQAVPAPGPETWRRIARTTDEYRHVVVSGALDNDRETLVQAVTELGPGFWVMTPLRSDAGPEFLVNRGFVPAEKAARAARIRPAGRVTVTGLLRISEPHGGFLRANLPGQGRWYSRDVPAIAQARGLAHAAPYFIDADATPNPGGWPRGGLTVVRFHNSHLVYALTWFGLAGMSGFWAALPYLQARRSRRRSSGTRLAPAHGPQR